MINEIRKVITLIKDVEYYRQKPLTIADINKLISEATEILNIGSNNFIIKFRCGTIIFCQDASDIFIHIHRICKALYNIRIKQPNRCKTVEEYLPRHKAVKYMLKELDILIILIKTLCSKCDLNYDDLKKEAESNAE